MRATLYHNPSLSTLTKEMNEGKLNFNAKDYTFVRREGIVKSFEQMGMEVKDFKNRTEATVYLKELFADYTDQYPELFAETDRYNVNYSEIFPIINQWAQDNDIPYAGWQYSDGFHGWAGDRLCAWLPVRVAGEFAFVWGNSGSKRANFYCGDEGFAHLSVSFRDVDLSIPVKLKAISQPYNNKTMRMTSELKEVGPTRKGMKILLDGYFEQDENDRKLTKALNSYLCSDFPCAVGGGLLGDAVSEYLNSILGEYWYNNFEEFYNKGFDWIADHDELIDIGYCVPFGEGGNTWKVERSVDQKQAKSYKELTTFEEVFNYYYPELLSQTN